LTGFFFAGAWTASGFLILEAACFSHSVDIVFFSLLALTSPTGGGADRGSQTTSFGGS